MEMFRKWLVELPTNELLNMVQSLSATITALRDKPFCTIRQQEELQNDLGINRLLLQLTFEELKMNRSLSEEENAQLNMLLGE